MHSKEPWLENWNLDKPLGKGGQGTTYVVSRKKDGQIGVLKVLKHQENDEARRRMFREAANLKTLHVAGCKVPQLIDGNTEQFEVKDAPLFFVMEFIPGERLCDLVQRTTGLGLEKSIGIALDLSVTVEKALKEDVIHRDLKPENMVVRNVEANDVVIVDYGLSFNAAEDEDLTHASETLDNKFCSLPERRVPGGNRRDPRSELTGVCAILYYCITAKPPVDLIGPDGRPPHRRPSCSIREKLGEQTEVSRLELLLDRGLASNIDVRFQTVAELVARLQEVLHPKARIAMEDPKDVAKRSAELLLKHNRAIQIQEYQRAGKALPTELDLVRQFYGNMPPFKLSQGGIQPHDYNIENTDSVNIRFAIELTVEANPDHSIAIVYQIRAKGDQCAVFRALFKQATRVEHGTRNTKKVRIGNWEAILWYDGLITPDWDPVCQDFKACINESIRLVELDILSPKGHTSASK